MEYKNNKKVNGFINQHKDKIFYHGSNSKFTQFDKSKIKENKLGLAFNFTDDYSIAYQYGDNIIKAHLDLNNPITYDELNRLLTYDEYLKLETVLTGREAKSTEDEWKKNKFTLGKVFNWYKHLPEFIQYLQELGYDGLAFPEDNHYGVFKPEQIHIIQEENFNSLNEKLEKLNGIEYLYNPTKSELLGLCNKSKDEIRGILMVNTNEVYIWNAYNYTHSYISSLLGLEGYMVEFRINKNTIFGNTPDGYLREDQIQAIKNSRLADLNLSIGGILENLIYLNEYLERFI